MTTTRLRIAIGVIGLLAAGLAKAQTVDLTVYAKMQAPVPVGTYGQVSLTTGTTTPAIACATNNPAVNCKAAVATGGVVTLTASTPVNAAFTGWGDGCAEKDPLVTPYMGAACTVTMATAKTVYANFRPAAYTLSGVVYPKPASATATPAYGGTLTTVSGMSCAAVYGTAFGPGCVVAEANGSAVTVTAVPNAGSLVTRWVGCTSSTATTCVVDPLNGPKAVAAYFGPTHMPVTVAVLGSGTVAAPLGGAVTNAISCGVDCTGAVTPGGTITLTATAASGSKFLGWSGACTGTATCVLTNVTSAKSVAASFKSASCNACHSVPPASHSGMASKTNCSTCHTNYTSSTSCYRFRQDRSWNNHFNRKVKGR